MLKIESRPIANKKFEYFFYADISGNMKDEKSLQDRARFSQKIAEYLMAQRPIITVDTGDIPYYFTHGKNAYILKTLSVEQLGGVLQQIEMDMDEAKANLTLLCIDFGFYSYFQNHMNILMFGVFEDDTKALFSTIVENYPVVLVGIGFILIFVFIYLLTICITLFFVHIADKTRERTIRIVLLFLSILVPSCIGGLRDLSVGKDVLLYGTEFFQYAKSCDSIRELFENMDSTEYGYFLLNYLCARFCNNIHFFLWFSEFFKLSLMIATVWFFRKKVSSSIIIFSYMIFFWILGLSMLRQSLALSLCIYSLTFYYNKKLI